MQDLKELLRNMEPLLHDQPYGIAVWEGEELPFQPFATVAEKEGLTVIARQIELSGAGVEAEPWARISLTVHSDLAAVGLTAAFAKALGDVGISANVVAGYHHDHIFVQWERRHDAVDALNRLARDA